MDNFNYKTICNELLEELPQRQKQVLARRFGLEETLPETLQSIGNDLGITRERVRQLEKSGFLNLKNSLENKNLKKALAYFEKYLQDQGGQKREDLFLNETAGPKAKNFAGFLLSLADNFYRLGDNDELYPFWAIAKEKESAIKGVIGKVKEVFHKEKRTIPLNELSGIVGEDSLFLTACLEIARDIEKGPLGNFGLCFWPEVKPKGVRDAAYLVLKKQAEPLHFTAIATKAGELQGELFAKRKMLPQTIHNELIRDPRFILVGRGIYGLNEWGYTSGTVKEVIGQVLQNSGPLGKEEIISAVAKQRLVKPNTILLNLSNKNYFVKDQSGKYSLKIKIA